MIFGLGDDAEVYGPPLSLASPAAQKTAAKVTAKALAAKSAPAKKPASSSGAIDFSFVDSLPLPAFVTESQPVTALSARVGSALGLPPRVALLTMGLAAAGALAWYLSRKRGGGKRARNPKEEGGGGGRRLRHRDPDVQKAIDFREAFHWGIPARTVAKRKIYPRPRVLVELGRVHSITYKTKKRGETARLFEHEFEGALPTLGMDIRNKRLHFVGGSYTVTDDGITG